MIRGARRDLSATLLVWGVPMWVEVAALVRSVGLAWGIGVDDLGRALILALTLRLAEMLSDVGIERMIHVSPRRDEPAFRAALHGAAVLRGLGIAVVLLAVALPMAVSFEDGASVASFAALALAPLIRGFLNLEYRCHEAKGQHGPMALVEGVAALVMITAMPSAVLAFGDERAIVALLLVQVLVQVAISHVITEAPYQIRFDTAEIAALSRFGLPLIVNAGLMFLAVQADRFIVAAFYGWAEVAAYGIAFQLATLPAQIAGRAAASGLTAAMAGPDGAKVLTRAMWRFAALAFAFAVGFAVLAPWVIGLLYGAHMQPPVMLALGLGLAAGLRILRTPLSVRAVAVGRTGDPARANLWRAAALLPALAAALLGLPLAVIALVAALGEAAAAWRGWRLLHTDRTPFLPKTRALPTHAL